MGRAAAMGGYLGLLVLCIVYAAHARQPVYIDGYTGQRVLRDGSPNPHWGDDITRLPGFLGVLIYVVVSVARVAAFVAACAGLAMVFCGICGAVMLVASIWC